jgi:multiple sugar transport system permease protein
VSDTVAGLRGPQPAQALTGERVRRRRQRAPGGKTDVRSIIAIVVLLLVGIGMVAPFIWMLATSMRPSTRAYDLPPQWLPFPLRSQNYEDAVSGPVPLLRTMWNSAVIAIAVSIAQLITCPMAGYAFARLRFPGRDKLLVALLASLMVPIQVTIIPLFLLMREFQLINNPLSLILPLLTSAFGVFLMRQFFLGVPESLLEAAKIDGAGPWTTYRLVALPLAKPGLSALGTITFLTTWNAYFAPSIFLNSIENATMPLALVLMLGPYKTGSVAMIMAATTIAILPAFLVYLVAQRWIVESLTSSGVKG